MGAKGKPKTPGSGRRVGVPNRVSLSSVEEICRLRMCNPIDVMFDLMMNIDTNEELKFKCAKELAEYIYAKRRQFDVDVDMALARKAEEYAQMDSTEHIQLMENEIKRLKGET